MDSEEPQNHPNDEETPGGAPTNPDSAGEKPAGAGKNPAGPPRVRASDSDRDAVLSILGDAHSSGRLDVEELDDRQTAAMHAKFRDELAPLVADLPEGSRAPTGIAPGAPGALQPGALPPDVRRGPAAASPAPMTYGNGTRGENNLPALPGGGRPQTSVAIMGGRDLVVEPGTPEVTSYSMWGGDNIFLRSVMAPGVQVTVNLFALMAGTDIFVPPGVKVVDHSVCIMGGNGIDREARGDGSNGTVVLKGLTIMGGHDVKLDRGAAPQLT